MQDQELYETIEKYIAGQLSGQALAAFEKKLEENPGLKAEVALHRKLQKELGNSQKNKLRQELATIRTEFSSQKEIRSPIVRSINWRRTLSIAATFLLFGSALWYFFFSNAPEQEIIVEQPVINPEEVTSDTSQSPLRIEAPEERVVEQPRQGNPEQQNVPPQKEEIAEVPTPETPAAPVPNFDVNPMFEALISANAQQRIYEFNVEIPGTDQVFKREDGKTFFQFAGLLIAPKIAAGEILSLHVFSNSSSSIEPGKAISSSPISLEEQKEELEEDSFAFAKKLTYFFNLEQNLSVYPGLYYYVVYKEVNKNPASLYAGKFRVD